MKRVPKFVYNGQTLTLSIPQRSWTPASDHVGGGNESALGAVERYTIRRDELLNVRLRFTEAEWPAVLAMVSWAQGASTPLRYYPNQDESTYWTCYVKNPGPRERVSPERDGDFGKVLELPLTLRASDGTPFGGRYF